MYVPICDQKPSETWRSASVYIRTAHTRCQPTAMGVRREGKGRAYIVRRRGLRPVPRVNGAEKQHPGGAPHPLHSIKHLHRALKVHRLVPLLPPFAPRPSSKDHHLRLLLLEQLGERFRRSSFEGQRHRLRAGGEDVREVGWGAHDGVHRVARGEEGGEAQGHLAVPAYDRYGADWGHLAGLG